MGEKAILLPIKKKWLDLIFAGKKIIEIRKFSPRVSTVYLYETKEKGGSGKILAKCSVGDVTPYKCPMSENSNKEIIHRRSEIARLSKFSCVPIEEIYEYAGWPCRKIGYGDIFSEGYSKNSGKVLYGWKLENVQKVDLNLSDFGLTRAPQSFCYVAECNAL